MGNVMRLILALAFGANVLTIAIGCNSKSGDAPGGGSDANADLSKIWDECKDHYRKTKRMPPPSEISGNLAARYNYQSVAGISLYKHSTNVIAYESEPKNGKRFVLFSDGRIEQLTDKQLVAVSVDPDPKTAKERAEKRDTRDKKEMDEFMKKAQDRIEKEEKEREDRAKTERDQNDREVEKAREEMEKKRNEFQELQKKQREKADEIDKTKNPKAAVPGPSKPSAVTHGTLPNVKPDIQAALKKKVSLKSPYPQTFAGAPTDRISVQYAVADILKQAGVEYDLEKSRTNLGELARRWVTPDIADKSCEDALQIILRPLAITYEFQNDKAVLKLK